MTATDRILLVSGDPQALDGPTIARLEQSGFEVTRAGERDDPLRLAETQPTCLIILDGRERHDGGALLRRLKAGERTGEIPVLLLLDPEPSNADAWAAGAEGILRTPAGGEALVTLARLLIVAHRQKSAQRAERERLETSIQRLLDLVIELGEAALPGFRARSEIAASIAARIASQFDIPNELHADLLTAARLHAIGRCLVGDGHDPDAGPWRWAVASARELHGIPQLEVVGDLVQSSAEHWDGSGRPDGRQRGQIPLRSRILRITVDLLNLADTLPAGNRDRQLKEAFRLLEPHVGTWYDPAVAAALAIVVADMDGEMNGTEWIAADRLEPGMTLEQDLTTASGAKLLSRGSVITSASLATIIRRHLADPIVHSVRVRRLGR
ncbi:MAG: hypothetical protein HOP28_13185 [Gemmatimonadales bacterium]|nr:hypothetical protein [Gemmatimonadales bacterium]